MRWRRQGARPLQGPADCLLTQAAFDGTPRGHNHRGLARCARSSREGHGVGTCTRGREGAGSGETCARRGRAYDGANLDRRSQLDTGLGDDHCARGSFAAPTGEASQKNGRLGPGRQRARAGSYRSLNVASFRRTRSVATAHDHDQQGERQTRHARHWNVQHGDLEGRIFTLAAPAKYATHSRIPRLSQPCHGRDPLHGPARVGQARLLE